MRRPHRQHTSSAPDASQLEVEEHKYCNRLSYSAAPQQRRPADHRHRHRLDPRNRGFAQAARSEGGRRPPSATLELGGSGGVIRTGSARAPSRLLFPALQSAVHASSGFSRIAAYYIQSAENPKFSADCIPSNVECCNSAFPSNVVIVLLFVPQKSKGSEVRKCIFALDRPKKVVKSIILGSEIKCLDVKNTLFRYSCSTKCLWVKKKWPENAFPPVLCKISRE